MSQIANVRDTAAETKELLFAPIRRELSRVEQILQTELRSDAPFVDQLVRHGCLLGGKRLRPALLLLAARATGSLVDEHLVLAAVVEMIHTATLVHDDVLDEAKIRRHTPTVNSRWDNQASVLLGDFLFTHAFYLASTLDTTFACRTIGRATNIVCEGELRQVGHRGNYVLDESEYLSIVEAKTAELCACCCQLGAYYSGADAQVVESLGRYGRALGIAFQIADDLLDLQGQEETTGKSLGTDLEKQKPTLPLIHALGCATAPQRKQLLAVLTRRDHHPAEIREELSAWLLRFGSFTYAQQKAESFANQACHELAGLPDGSARAVLQQLTEFVVGRTH